MAQKPLVVQGLLIIEASRSRSDIPHLVGFYRTSNRPDAGTSTGQHTALTRDNHALAGFKPKIPASEQPQTHALDLAATGIGTSRHSLDIPLTLKLLMSYIYGAPSKARNANFVYIWTYVWQRLNSLFLFAAQCFNTESMQRGFLCHICV